MRLEEDGYMGHLDLAQITIAQGGQVDTQPQKGPSDVQNRVAAAWQRAFFGEEKN